MPAINLRVSQEAMNAWSDMNMKSAYQFIVLRVTEDFSMIELDATYERNANQQDSFQKLVEMVSQVKKECRFIFFRVDWEHFEGNGLSGGKRSKVVMLSCTGCEAPVKNKLMHAACKGPLRRTLNCSANELQTSLQSLCLQEVIEKAKQYTK